MIQKGTMPKKIMKEFPEIKLEQNWTVRQRRVYQKQIHNWNGCSSMSGAVLNSRFLTRLLVARIGGRLWACDRGKEGTSSTACELTMLILIILFHSVWLVWPLHL